MEIRNYIASQISQEGLDELQRMALAYALKLNIALDGPPGVGKTQSVFTFAEILGKRVYEKGCSEDTSENQIIGFPKLVEESGATVTAYENGPLAKAMASGDIFYGDEFNLLRKDKQKRLNAAFDDRRRIIRADDVEIKAIDGFLGIISYNPTKSLSIQDLEDSVADRFVHIHYQYMVPRIEAYLGSLKVSEIVASKRPNASQFSIQLERRAILWMNNFADHSSTGHNKSHESTAENNSNLLDQAHLKKIRFLLFLPNQKQWVDFFSGDKVEIKAQIHQHHRLGIYYAYKKQEQHRFHTNTMNTSDLITAKINDFSLKLTGFFSIIRNMTLSGAAALPSNIRAAYASLGDIGQLTVHLPSLRIHSYALAHCYLLLTIGMSAEWACNYASHLAINQICFGKYRERKSGEFSNFEIVSAIAESFNLIRRDENLSLNNRFNKKVEIRNK